MRLPATKRHIGLNLFFFSHLSPICDTRPGVQTSHSTLWSIGYVSSARFLPVFRPPSSPLFLGQDFGTLVSMLGRVFTTLTTLSFCTFELRLSRLFFAFPHAHAAVMEQETPTPTAAAQALQRSTSPTLRVINTIQACDTDGRQLRRSTASGWICNATTTTGNSCKSAACSLLPMRFNRRNSSAADRDASRPDTLNRTPPSVENMLRDRGDPPPAAQAPLGPTTTMPPQPGRANAQTSAPKSPASGIGARGTTTTGARESRPCLGAATPTLILLRFSEWHQACNNTRLSECSQKTNSPGWPSLPPSMLKPLPRFPS